MSIKHGIVVYQTQETNVITTFVRLYTRGYCIEYKFVKTNEDAKKYPSIVFALRCAAFGQIVSALKLLNGCVPDFTIDKLPIVSNKITIDTSKVDNAIVINWEVFHKGSDTPVTSSLALLDGATPLVIKKNALHAIEELRTGADLMMEVLDWDAKKFYNTEGTECKHEDIIKEFEKETENA